MLIVLELNKGTLTIECDADDVPIRIVQGDKVYKTLTVTRAGKSVRVAAGNYVIVIDYAMDVIAVRNGKVSLRRGTNELVRIVRSDKTAPEADGRETVLNALNSRSGEIALEKPPQNDETDFANLLQRWRQLTGMVITGPRTDVSRHGTNVKSALLSTRPQIIAYNE